MEFHTIVAMRGWLHRWRLRLDTSRRGRNGYRRGMSQLEPVHLAELLHECPGKWVGLRNGEIIEVRDTFDQVVTALRDRGITNATVMRSPAEEEAELVGLG